MQLEQTLRTLCALPAVSGFEMQAAKAVAELFQKFRVHCPPAIHQDDRGD